MEIAVVGLGQAGGNLAAEMNRRGYRALALNTANTDLSSLSATGLSLPEDQRLYIGIDGHDGAGSDLNYGRECINANADIIRERVRGHVEGADLVLVMAGLGGGTGSAVGELIRVLDELSLPVLVLATLPNQHESGIAKVNAVKAVNMLVTENLLGWMFIDNSRLAQNFGDVSLGKYYTEINKRIVDPLHAFNTLNDREGIQPIRSLDGEDFRTLLLSGGILNISDGTIPRLDVDSVMRGVREAIQLSPVMPEGFSLEHISYLGVVIEAPDSALDSTPFNAFEQISEQLKDETGGAAVYVGVYRAVEGTDVRLRIVASTQTLPDGVQEMVSSARREGGQLRDKLQQTLSGLDLGEIEEYELFRATPGTRRRIADPSMGGGVPRRIDTGGAQPRPTASVAPPSSGGVDREVYDQLIQDYRDAGDDADKQRVSERLTDDSKSSNSLVRYYAVRAMSKIDPSAFSDALRMASQDEDATVRAVASKALQAQ